MSKMDGLRAMREARYAENAARAKTAAPAAKKQPVKPAATKSVAAKSVAAKSAGPKAPAATPDGVEPALCGHRNMSGRTCTRELGHSAKSHRYS